MISNPEFIEALGNPALRDRIDFWKQIYAVHEKSVGVVHDARYIDKIYEVVKLDVPGRKVSQMIRESKEKWRRALLRLHGRHGDHSNLTPEEIHLLSLFQDIDDPNKFLNAAHRKRLRFQTGHRESFLKGLEDSGKWLPLMEKEFAAAGLPLELTRLPFVESSFNLQARSSVGASGIWQFMRGAGSQFLKIAEGVDERNDPVRAARAAAQLLKQNYDSLGKWPLAVTAYNHGRLSLMRAVRALGSDRIEDVIEGYKSRTFGFSSINFLSCLLASLEVERDARRYFGDFNPGRPWNALEVPLPASVSLTRLSEGLGIPALVLADLNPAWDRQIIRGKLRIPAGYMLRLPLPEGADPHAERGLFEDQWAKLPPKWKFSTPRI